MRIAGCRALLSLGAPAFCERGFSRRAAAYRRGARPRGATGPPSHCQSRVQCAASRDGPQRGCRAARHRGGGRGSRGRCGRVEARVLHRGVAVVSVASRIAAWRSVGGVGGGRDSRRGGCGKARMAGLVGTLGDIYVTERVRIPDRWQRFLCVCGRNPHMAVVVPRSAGGLGGPDLRGIGRDFEFSSDVR